jgi:N-acetylglucosamine-6-phosphate deacetylase
LSRDISQERNVRIRARHYATGDFVDVVCVRGKITEIDDLFGPRQKPDIEAGWVAPALFDLQINGCDGRSFNSPQLTTDDVFDVVRVCRAHGIGALCPTLVTNSSDALVHGFGTLARACEMDSSVAAALPAFHLEGPYISAEDGPRGAHPLGHVRPPDRDDFERYQQAAGGRIRLVTLAPEREGALPFIEKLVASGVVVALGHTAASGGQIRAAVAAGACLSTHLGNGTHATLPRHDNYLLEQLAADGLWASIICDGHHLPPALIKCILRMKTASRTVLTCDASSLAGMPPGRYEEWGQELEVMSDGKVVVPGTPFLAGSGVFTDTCIGIAIRDGGVSLREALDMAGARPRSLLGLEARLLAPGSPADLVLFDYEPGTILRVTGTVIDGDLTGKPAHAD